MESQQVSQNTPISHKPIVQAFIRLNSPAIEGGVLPHVAQSVRFLRFHMCSMNVQDNVLSC